MANLSLPTSHPSVSQAEDELNLSDLLDTLLQYAWLLISVFAFIVILGVAYATLSTPIYQADALVQVEANKTTPLSGVQEIADALGTGANPVSGEIEILRSREVVMKAVDATRADLRIKPKRFPVIGDWVSRRRAEPESETATAPFGLSGYAWGKESLAIDRFEIPEMANDYSFTILVNNNGYQIFDADESLLGEGVVGALTDFNTFGGPARILISKIEAAPGVSFSVTRATPVRVYREILSNLEVKEVGKQSSIIKVTYENPDVDFGQRFVNALARAYLTQNVERRSAEADQSLKFLAEQLPEIKRNVERAEDALNSFRTRTNTVSVEKSTDTLLTQAVDVEKKRLELELKRDELRQRFQPTHPELRAIEAQLAATSQDSNKVNEMVSRLPAAQRDLLRLQRDAQVNNELYIALLNNTQQLKVAKAGTVGNVRIIDYALKDINPVAPKKLIIVAGSAILGLLLGVGAALVARWLRPTVRDAAELERATGLVSYANVPESEHQERLDSHQRDKRGRQLIVDGRNQLLSLLQPDDPAIESLRSLRTGLAFALMGAQNKNIVITGATAGLGKSFVSANLSVLLATTGKRVLLVETDMRRPQLGTYFGYTKRKGLSDLLAGSIDLNEALLKGAAGVATLDVLPAGEIPPNPGELLLSPAFSALIEKEQVNYDHIIMDSAPVLPVGDTLAVASCAALTFLVVRAELSTVGEVRDAVKKLGSVGVAVKGLIFNGVKRYRVGYGYTYKYYYGYGDK